MIKKQTLKRGPGSMQHNMVLLSAPVESAARHKGILTLMEKHNLSYEDAQLYQAQRIAESRLKKK